MGTPQGMVETLLIVFLIVAIVAVVLGLAFRGRRGPY
jgi:hypothetical protein